MYFTFDDIGGIDGVQRWLEVASAHRTELGRVMATRYGTDMYLEDRIMNVCAALDSLDKQRRNTGKHVNDRPGRHGPSAGPRSCRHPARRY
jgi:hypothetical protein